MVEQLNAQQVTVTVKGSSPLWVLSDGAQTPVPAVATDGATYAVGDRVQVTIRTPQRPLVTGRVEATV